MGRWLPAIDNDGKISAFQVFFFRASWNFGMNVWFFFFFSFFLFGLQVTGYRLRKLYKIICGFAVGGVEVFFG